MGLLRRLLKRLFSPQNLMQWSTARSLVMFFISAVGLEVSPNVADAATRFFIDTVTYATAAYGFINFVRDERKGLPAPKLTEILPWNGKKGLKS